MNFKRDITFWMLGCLIGCNVYAQSQTHLSANTIDGAAIAEIPAWNANSALVVLHLDLTKPFATKSQWTMVALDDPHQAASGNAPVAICFVKRVSAQCTEDHLSDGDTQFYSWRLIADRVVYTRPHNSRPLLWLKTYASSSVNGSGIIKATLFRYDRHLDQFARVFSYGTFGTNNNQNARYIDRGPLTGDVVTDYPTERAPYTYWVEVYAPGNDGEYVQILRYRGHTGYNDGNQLPVANSEMPEILRRLGRWKPGDALPVPGNVDCPHPALRSGEEWCE